MVPNMQRWMKPRGGELKYNVNAALFNQEGKYGISLGIRNDKGEFFKPKTITFAEIPLP